LPNSKKISRVFCEILSPKNSFRKTESAFRPATLPEALRAEPQKEKIVEHYLHVTGLAEFADFYPKDLSGGMQQRAAIGRTLANNPKVLLMDEPFGSLDTQTRSQMQEFLTKLWESDHQTIVFVTHDVNEAIFLADKVCVLSKRPTKIKNVYNVPFSRPRSHEIKHAPEFFAFASKIAKELED
ncbi:MAG TPA: ATP-binding cassette domain-containing protein, partial [Candidatus Paceibacterota bacterium]